MIPKVKTYLVRMIDERHHEIKRCYVNAPTKTLARLNHIYLHMGEAVKLGAYKVTYTAVRTPKN